MPSPIEMLVVILAAWTIAAFWNLFEKAGQPGWTTLIPFYNAFIVLQICGKPAWWLVLLLVPGVNAVAGLLVAVSLARSFGRDRLFGVGLFLAGFILVPVLAYGGARYQGPAG